MLRTLKKAVDHACSWSKSGQLLASGSDDTHLLIHSYQPNGSTSPFVLTTSLSTGHTANIFSVKFMPHSNDRTVITAAGDAECRVFDLEHSGGSTVASNASSAATAGHQRHAARFSGQGVRYLTDGDTGARVYRSHSDRVKRIVTESSPYLFLTCSEDGTVRQWDLRLPSSAYPRARGGRGFASHRSNHDDSNVPPPLISYKRYRLDLNTISCSESQPHYIVLGGAHLHCFLHDRRMLGRDRLAERGSSAEAGSSPTDGSDDLMGEATRCVRRFAPNGRNKMRRRDNGHVTACKISDANPNEMIGSWSGDHIYSFDLIKSPDAKDTASNAVSKDINGKGKGKVRESQDRKRKRKQIPSSSSIDQIESESTKSRRTSAADAENGNAEEDVVLRLRYENGQSEDIPIERTVPRAVAQSARDTMLTEAQKRSQRIAKSLTRIRKLMFSLDTSSCAHQAQSSNPLVAHQSTFTSVLGLCAAIVPEMNDIDRHWLFPTRPSPGQAGFHTILRNGRDRARKFVLAVGTLAKALGGKLRTASGGESSLSKLFEQIPSPPLPAGDREWEPGKAFSYLLLKAILLWLESGTEALIKGFQKRNSAIHLPIPQGDTGITTINQYLVPFLDKFANPSPIPNVDASRFEHDDNRQLFVDESAALRAFSRAVRIPLRDGSDNSASMTGDRIGANGSVAEDSVLSAQDRETARRFWAFRVGRGLLLKAGEGVDFGLVDRSFGGLGMESDTEEGRSQEDVDLDEEEPLVRSVAIEKQQGAREHAESSSAVDQPSRSTTAVATSLVDRNGNLSGVELSADAPASDEEAETENSLEDNDANEASDYADVQELMALADSDTNDNGADDDDDEGADVLDDEDDADVVIDDDEHVENDDEVDEDDSDIDVPVDDRHSFWRSLTDTPNLRAKVQKDIPVAAHTRVYRGHCNVQTIKDVNFFGRQDEYVVSGSDSGHFFIWDRKTSKLLNILEGDGEVVNVVQGAYPVDFAPYPSLL